MRRRELHPLLALLVFFLLIASVSGIACALSSREPAVQDRSLSWSHEQFAREILNCSPSALHSLGKRGIINVVDNYLRAKREGHKLQPGDGINTRIPLTTRMAYYPNTSSAGVFTAWVGFNSNGCGFTITTSTEIALGSVAKRLPHNLGRDVVNYIGPKGEVVSINSKPACYSITYPAVMTVNNYRVVHAPCSLKLNPEG